jgi:hypothetical protein
MKKTIKTTLFCVALLASGTCLANFHHFSSADKAAKILNSLVKGGPTDTECAKIDLNFSIISRLLPALSKAQQKAVWDRYPYMAGIACYRSVGHEWYGNDCAFQCGSYSECQVNLIEK